MAKTKRRGGTRSSRGTPPPPIPEGWKARATSLEELLELVARLPEQPGVYLMRDRKGVVVYVGKARRLRARVRQYFSGQDSRRFVPLLGDLLGDLETVVTANDKEALLLENTLIKAHRPRFNVKLRDDKQYLVLRLDPNTEWPRLTLVRRVESDGAHYFGPYHSAGAVRHALRVVNRHFKLRTCSDYVLRHRRRACLQHQIGRCPAPCVRDIDTDAYGEQVRHVALFLGGRHRKLVADLKSRMQTAAAALDFESAARLRDQVKAIETTLESQRVVSSHERDQDVIGMYREGGQVEFVVMHIRQGKLLGTRVYSQRGMELPDPEVLHSFLAAYYADAPMIPDEVLLPVALVEDDAVPLSAWLREQSGRKTALLTPERGDRRKLLRLAQRNAASNFVSRRNQRDDAEQALSELQQRFGLSRLPRVIECYDISHIQGSDTVASMVVFVDGVAVKERYRSFKIRGLHGTLAQGNRQNDDFASMAETLDRRLRRGLEVASSGEPTRDDPWALPDLLVIDGGKGQLGRVLAAMQDMGVPIGAEGVDVIALAKERRLELGHGKSALRRLRARRASFNGAADDEAGDTLPKAAANATLDSFFSTPLDTANVPDDPSNDPSDDATGDTPPEAAANATLDSFFSTPSGTASVPDNPSNDPSGDATDGTPPEAAANATLDSFFSTPSGTASVPDDAPDDTTNVPDDAADDTPDISADTSDLSADTSDLHTGKEEKEEKEEKEKEEKGKKRPGQALREFVVATADEVDAPVTDDGDLKPERVFVPGRRDAIRLRPGSSELYLLTRIRDEAHRFAISHHRKRRGKRALVSVLDSVPGVGPAAKKALIKHFGSIAAIKLADVDALQAVKGIGPRLAAKIRETLGKGETTAARATSSRQSSPSRVGSSQVKT